MTPFSKNINYVLTHCGALKESESLIILCDETTKDLGEAFEKEAGNISKKVKLMEIPLAKKHGEEPSEGAREYMVMSDLIISLCKYSLAHSKARTEAAAQGARFLSMPFYSWDLLNNPAVTCDYQAQAPIVRRVADAFTKGFFVYVTTSAGTDIKLDIRKLSK